MTVNELFTGLSPEEIIDSFPGGCLWLDESNKPIFCNSALVDVLGTKSKEDALAYFDDVHLRSILHEGLTEFNYLCRAVGGVEKNVFLRTKPAKIGDNGFTMVIVTELQDEEERWRLMLNAAPLSVCFFDSDLNIFDCNAEAIRMYGLSYKEELNAHFFKLMPPLQADGSSSLRLMKAHIKSAFESGRSMLEIVRQRVDGVLMPTESIFVRVEHKGGFIVVGYTRDLTDVHNVLDREREAKETAQIYMDTSPVGVELWSEHMQAVDCNQQIVDMFGFIDKQTFLNRVKGIWQGEHIAPIFLHQAFEDGFARYEWDFKRVDGTVLPCEVQLVRVVRDGRPQVMAYFLDLSDVKKAIDLAREADKRAMLMLDATPLACFLVRENMTALDCNQAAVELFGFSNKAEALERYREIFPVISPDGRPMKVPTELEWVNTTESMRFEYNHIDMNGGYIPCDVTMIYLDHQGQPIVACYLRDLREIKAMIAEMKRIEVAEEESRAKSQFLARMSHEIRTPMNAIMGVTDIQLLKGGHPAEMEEALMQIRSSSNILLSIINDILDLSKVEAGKMELFKKPYEIASLILDTVQLNLMHVGSKSIIFNLEVDENMPAVIIGDELRIKQILNNLLSNAFKYTKEGEVRLSFGFDRSDQDLVLLITLADTGQGMTESQLKTLFQGEYIRFNEQENRMIEGTGLGMNITNRLIQMMKGSITAESKPGKGSAFHVRLPQRVETDKVLGRSIVENLKNFQISQRDFQKRYSFEYEQLPFGNVLVVDDVESNLFVAKGLMMPYGLTVDTAMSGQEAIDKIQGGNDYDIVFMDHMMPEMDGIEAVKIIRDSGYAHPIVALTANTIMGQAELFMNCGFSGFISKPIDVSTLNSYLMRFIRDRHPEKATGVAEVAKPGPQQGVSPVVIASFLRDAERAVGVLEKLLDKPVWNEGDSRLYTVNIHGMKSALANVDKAELARDAGILEGESRELNDSYIRAKSPAFLAKLREIMSSFSSGLETEETDNEDKDLLVNGLRVIRTACEAYNKKKAKSTLDDLNKYPWTKETLALLQNISANLLHSAFEEAASEIDSYLCE